MLDDKDAQARSGEDDISEQVAEPVPVILLSPYDLAAFGVDPTKVTRQELVAISKKISQAMPHEVFFDIIREVVTDPSYVSPDALTRYQRGTLVRVFPGKYYNFDTHVYGNHADVRIEDEIVGIVVRCIAHELNDIVYVLVGDEAGTCIKCFVESLNPIYTSGIVPEGTEVIALGTHGEEPAYRKAVVEGVDRPYINYAFDNGDDKAVGKAVKHQDVAPLEYAHLWVQAHAWDKANKKENDEHEGKLKPFILDKCGNSFHQLLSD